MTGRRLYLERSPGEDRAVVTLDGRPERLWVERLGAPQIAGLGACYLARAARLDRSLGAAFLDLGGQEQALLSLTGPAKALAEGQAVEIEIAAEARRGKLAQARFLGMGQGAPRRLDAPVALAERLQAFAPGVAVTEGAAAREAADLAEEAALAIEHPMPGGGSLAIEPTRALVAVDVDLGERGGTRGRAAAQANLTAIRMAARLLRLKALGGLVVLDLVGEGGDGRTLAEIARQAFEPDGPGVVIGPVSRLGLLQLALPHRRRPVAEQLCEADGRLSAASWANRLARSLAREAEADRGARLGVSCAPAVLDALQPALAALEAAFGARFDLRADPARDWSSFDVRSA